MPSLELIEIICHVAITLICVGLAFLTYRNGRAIKKHAESHKHRRK